MCSSHTGNAPSRQVLPSDVVPRHYRLRLEPDLAKFTYTGEVEIDVDVKKTTSSVAVNILDLTIHSAEIDGQQAVDSTHDTDRQTLTWKFPSELKEGSQATVKVKFDGTLNDHLAGFYRSVHKDDNGVEQVVATTQMEATDARRAFPCFDEPALKATFDITLVADKKYTVLSNSDVKATKELSGGKVETSFNTTPKMSTYLVAFVVGELKYVESKEFRVPVRVYATPGLEDRCQFSADLAAKTLKFFEESFDITYPLPKLDMIGIHDFSAGAMENWGLVTYRVVDLFYVPGKDSVATKTRVAEVVQHELAHQWFGNLVTMEWWDGLWLNEGFATWMSWYSGNHFFPDWKVWETYVATSYQGCLNLDGLRSSHPIQVPVERADEINQIFDAISYLKGSCVIKMISQYLGEDVFIKGIATYLKRHAYANTVTDDLWQALSDVSGKDVKGQMDIWTKKIGYPVITVDESSGNATVRLTQNRYLATADVKPEEDETVYPVWLGVRQNDGSIDSTATLTERSTDLKVGEFFKLNADQNGIFRVKYTPERVAKFAEEGAKSDSRLSPQDRIGLVSDLRALAFGYSPTAPLLGLVNKWKSTENDVNVWAAIIAFLSDLKGTWLFEDQAVKDAIKKFAASVVVPKAKEIGYTFGDNESIQTETLKADLFSASVGLDDPEFIKVALDLYAQGFEKINPNLRSAVFRAVAKKGTEKQWEELFDIYKAGTNGVTGNAALGALAYTPNFDLKKRVLESLLDGTVRTQDAFMALTGFGVDSATLELAWKWIQSEWTRLIDRYPPSLGLLARFTNVAGAFTKPAQLESADKFFAEKDVKGIDRQVRVNLDKIRTSVKWLDSSSSDVSEWLKAEKFL